MTAETAMGLISACASELMVTEPFFGMLYSRLKKVEDPSCDTMWVDGVSLGFSPKYLKGKSRGEIKAVLLHEILHCALGHPWRRKNRDPKQWNHACDYAINYLVKKSGYTLPGNTLDNPAWYGWHAEAIYDVLPKTPPSPKPQANKSSTENNESSGQSGAGAGAQGDSSDESGTTASDSGTADSPDASPGEGESNPGQRGGANGAPNDSGGEPTPGEVRDAPVDSQESERALEADWQQSMRAARSMAGKLKGAGTEVFKRGTKTRVRWREELRRFVEQSFQSMDYSMMEPADDFLHLNVYLPSLQSDSLGDVVVVVDTSSSVSSSLLSAMGEEICSMMEEIGPRTVYLLEVDTTIHKISELTSVEDFPTTFHGRGGTSFDPAFDWVEAQGLAPRVFIYCTDLECSMPKTVPGYPVLWLVPDNAAHQHVTFGEVLPVDFRE